jgi:hypothetical protein
VRSLSSRQKDVINLAYRDPNHGSLGSLPSHLQGVSVLAWVTSVDFTAGNAQSGRFRSVFECVLWPLEGLSSGVDRLSPLTSALKVHAGRRGGEAPVPLG